MPSPSAPVTEVKLLLMQEHVIQHTQNDSSHFYHLATTINKEVLLTIGKRDTRARMLVPLQPSHQPQ
jgi:hypothetical protein